METLRLYATLGDLRLVAHRLGVSHQTVKTFVGDAYRRLDVDGHMGAFIKLGWLCVPEE
jgi:DNA-binding CsgD family transcriptional regulator